MKTKPRLGVARGRSAGGMRVIIEGVSRAGRGLPFGAGTAIGDPNNAVHDELFVDVVIYQGLAVLSEDARSLPANPGSLSAPQGTGRILQVFKPAGARRV